MIFFLLIYLKKYPNYLKKCFFLYLRIAHLLIKLIYEIQKFEKVLFEISDISPNVRVQLKYS